LNEQTAIEIITDDAAATQAVGAALGRCLAAGQVIALRGDLGAGKTTFVQGLARGLGVRERVASPTFVLVNEYAAAGGLRLVHIDTYRLGPAAADKIEAEAAAIGLDDLLADPAAVVAIEWAERVADLLPADHLLLELRYGPAPDARILRLTAHGPQSAAALRGLQEVSG
jgi:tRNA threonylcarbamoyladenosine biosynthesis protein TsaE